jgi:acyl dehydratase
VATATAHQGVPHFTMGTYEEGLKMIGAKSEVRYSESEINWPMIKYYCALVEDANPSFWDSEFARSQWGGLIAPPGMLQVWLSRIQWKPGGVTPSPSLADSIPLPGDTLINVSTEAEFLRPMRIGDPLSVVDEVMAISPEKTTRLGTGHFVTTVATYRNQRGEVVARNTNQLFRFSKQAATGQGGQA